MKYSGFILKNTNPTPYIKNKLQNKENNHIIYRAEYPALLKKKELIKPEVRHKVTISTASRTQMVEEKTNEVDEMPQNEVVIRESGGFTRVLCGILASVLCFTAVYLSGVKAPEYVQKGVLALVEYAKNSNKLNIQASAKDSNTKIIGGKEFVKVDAANDNSVDNAVANIAPDDENSKFAQSIMESGAQMPEKYPDVSVMSEQDDDTNQKSVPVIAKNMSKGSDKIYVTNRTELQLDFNKILSREYPIEKYPASTAVSDEPLVLLVHTHGTEAYINSTDNNVTRSNDTDKNVVRIGTELTRVLESYGIPVIHSKTMHDEISYIKAYDNSKAEVAEYLAKYPSIRYVIDLHRDALGSDGETPVKTFTTVNGESSAQLMFVMGTNAAGGNHPNYMNNLTVAANLQSVANQLYPGLMRPINVRPIIFNQNLADGCMILEVGSDANTIEEALAAVRMFGRCFAQTVCE